MRKIYQKPSFKRQLKKYKYNKPVMKELAKVVDMLISDQTLPDKYRNHKLLGSYEGMMELHLRPDDLLIYLKVEQDSITLVAIGSHAELFD